MDLLIDGIMHVSSVPRLYVETPAKIIAACYRHFCPSFQSQQWTQVIAVAPLSPLQLHRPGIFFLDIFIAQLP